MYISFFKMDDKYICSTEVDTAFDFEELCRKLVAFNLKEFLLEALPRLEEIKDRIEVTVEWSYEGYRMYIYGTKLTDDEIQECAKKIDPIKTLGISNLFWSRHSEHREYTCIVFAYDYRHYHKVIVDAHRFIILTYKGLDEFLEILGMTHDFLPIEQERLARKLHFKYDEKREKEINKDKLKGNFDLPEVKVKKRREK